MENVLYRPLSESEMQKQTCAPLDDDSHEQAKEYFPYIIFIMAYAVICCIIYILFFKPEMKRSQADATNLKTEEEEEAEVCILSPNNPKTK